MMDLAGWSAHCLEFAGLALVGIPAALDLRHGVASRPLVGDLRAAHLVEHEEAFLGARVRALMLRLAAKDPSTEGHTRRVATLAVEIGERLGLPEARLRLLALGGLLHDMGKLSVPDHILNKPGALTDEEFAVIKRHPVWGRELLVELGGFPPLVLALVESHHERVDGGGYPNGAAAARAGARGARAHRRGRLRRPDRRPRLPRGLAGRSGRSRCSTRASARAFDGACVAALRELSPPLRAWQAGLATARPAARAPRACRARDRPAEPRRLRCSADAARRGRPRPPRPRAGGARGLPRGQARGALRRASCSASGRPIADELAALSARLAPDVALDRGGRRRRRELAAVVPRAQVVAVARRPRQPSPDELLALPGPEPVMLLEEPRHLGNLGACVRVAAAAGAAGVITTGGRTRGTPTRCAARPACTSRCRSPARAMIRTGDRPLDRARPGRASRSRPRVPDARGAGVRHRARRAVGRAARARRRPPGAADAPGRVQPEPRDGGLGRAVLAQRTPMRSTTKTSVSSGPMTPPAPRLP